MTNQRGNQPGGAVPIEPAGPSRVLSLSEEHQKRPSGVAGAGWTLKGVPSETVEMTRQAARMRGMKIGAWVADALRQAAKRDLGDEPLLEVRDEAVLRRLDEVAE